jgi:hypothetical protein
MTKDIECVLIDDMSGSRKFYTGKGYYYKVYESFSSLYWRKLKNTFKKGKIKRNISEWKFYIKEFEAEAPLPPNCAVLINSKGDKTPFFHRALNGKVSYLDIEIDKPSKSRVKQIEPDIAMWGNQARKKVVDTYQVGNFWDKYKKEIMFAIAATLALVLIFLTLKKVDIIQEAARIFSEAATTIKSSSVINYNTTAP